MTEKQSKVKWECTIAQLSELFEVTKATICDWVKKGMAKESFGTYDLKKVLPWWLENIYKGSEDGSGSITEIKKRYWLGKAIEQESKNDERKKSLMPAAQVQAEWAERAAGLKSSLLAIGSRMAGALENKSAQEISTILKEEMTKLLEMFVRESTYCQSEPPKKKKIVEKKPAKKKPTTKKKRK